MAGEGHARPSTLRSGTLLEPPNYARSYCWHFGLQLVVKCISQVDVQFDFWSLYFTAEHYFRICQMHAYHKIVWVTKVKPAALVSPGANEKMERTSKRKRYRPALYKHCHNYKCLR